MNKLNCPSCGLANWSSAEVCVRCKNPLDAVFGDAPFERSAPPVRGGAPSEKRSYSGPIALAACGIIVLGVVYLFMSKGVSPRVETSAAAPASAPASGEVKIAEPPADYGIVGPNLEGFESAITAELTEQNGYRGVDQTKAAMSLSVEEKMKRNEQEVADGMRGLCNGGGGYPGECNSRLQGIKADQAAREHNEQMSSTKFCPPKIDGQAKITEPGRYHRYDDTIFYVGKVEANGFSGIMENGVCTFEKHAIVPLTAKIHLKWSTRSGAEGWLPSSQGEFNSVSMAYNKKVSETKKEEREKARYEKWQQQGREQANKRMQERVFRALNE